MQRNLDNQSKSFFVKILLSEALKLEEFEGFYNDFSKYLLEKKSDTHIFLFLMDDIWAQQPPTSQPIKFDFSQELREPTGTIHFDKDGLYDESLKNFERLALEYSFENRISIVKVFVQSGGGVMDENNWVEI
jgi:hypothetical protein